MDIENGVVTFVYDFATNQANGTIASVCLTSPRGAYMCEADTVPAALRALCEQKNLPVTAG